MHDTAAQQIRESGQVRLWWRSPTLDTPVDLFLPQHELHALVAARAEPVDFFGTEIKVLSATDLMIFKMLFDRRKDWADIEHMIECDAGDTADAKRWVARIVGADDRRLSQLDAIVAEVRGRS